MSQKYRNLSTAETATILCALRNFQEHPEPQGLSAKDVLTYPQLDDLCDTIGLEGGLQILSS